ncbi:MAG: beta-N-acetylhexosaminidase [Eubacteriales bacterium]|nr:beta-N-acetylhexosaminidase [Eubacteriales bacterium]
MKVICTVRSENYRELLGEIEAVLERGAEAGSYELYVKERQESGYRYEKEDGALRISCAGRVSLCRALLAAAQSTERTGGEDGAFAELGYMADCSRNAAANVPTLKRLVRTLALMGYSFLGLYIEDTIRVEGEPYVGYMRGAYSREEIREVIRYADLFGMEIRPYVQTLAHLNQLTRYAHYQKFVDTDDILLADDERTYEFLDHYLGAVADAFTTRTVNIGMDEAHMVGLGKYLDAHGYQNRVDIILKHLNHVMELCRKYGLHPQMWSDMFFRLAFGGEYYVADKELAANVQIPEGLELVYWDYYHTDETHYDQMLSRHQKLTQSVSFAGGAWKWTGFAPHNRYSITIGRAALAACRKNGVRSVVITGWGDNGAEASQFSTLPALFADANEAYERGLGEEAFRALTGISFADYLLVETSNPYAEREETHSNAGKYLLYNDPLIGTFDSAAAAIERELPGYYEKAARRLEEAALANEASEFAYVLRTQAALCRILRRKATLGLRLREAYRSGDRETLRAIAEAEIPESAVQLDAFYRIFRDQWYRENKTFGFEVQGIRIGGLRMRLIETGTLLRDYLEGTREKIEELEEAYLPFAYFEDDAPESLDYNLWHDIASPAVMG